MKTRLLSINNQAATEIRATTKTVMRLIMLSAMLAFGGLAAFAQSAGPVLTLPTSVTTMENTPIAVSLGVSDSGISVITVGITAKSSNTNVVGNAGLVVTGVGPNRQLGITPRLNQAGTATITLVATDGLSVSTTNTFSLNVTFTNYPPVFGTTITNLTRNENAASTNLSFTISDVQTAAAALVVTTISSNTNLVPNSNLVVSGTGTNRTLNLTQAANQNGSTVIQLIVTDTAGSSATNSFTLNVWAINQPPTFTLATNRLVYGENYGPVANLGFISNVTSGPANQSWETNHFVLNYNTNFFAQAPALDTNYDLSFQVGTNLFGTNTITFILYNNGPTTNGGKTSLTNTVTLAVPFSTQPPGFTLATTLVQAPEESGNITNKGLISTLSVGPANQSGEKWGFIAFTDTNSANDAFFATLPAVSTNGTLTFKPQAHSYGTNVVTLVMTNTGSTANGGVNAFTNTFQIGISQISHAPSIVTTNQIMAENGSQTTTISVWDYDQTTNLTLTATSLNTKLVTVSVSAPTPVSASNVVFTVNYTGVANAFGSNSVRFVASEGGNSSTNLVGVTVTHINQAPSFTLSAKQFVTVEESGMFTNKGMIYALSVGPTNQSGQTWTFIANTVTNNSTNALFAVLPAVSTNGTLTFKPLAHSYGTNPVTLIMTTSGSSANGGVNTATNTFQICVVATNHAPVISYTTNAPVLENSGSITNLISVSSYDQLTNMTVTALSLSNKVASVSINFSSFGVYNLTNFGVASNEVFSVVITPLTNAFGSAPIQLIATEGTHSTTNLMGLTVTHVNQAPSYSLSSANIQVLEESGAFTKSGFITTPSVGPANESGQTWAYVANTVTNSLTNALFATLPAIATNGTLSFTPQAHSFGTNIVTVVMTDNGGTANGGINSYTNTFQISVIQTNHAPVIAGATNQTEFENGGPVTNTITLSDYDLNTNLTLTATSLSNAVASVSLTATNYTAVSNSVVFTLVLTPVTNAFGTDLIRLTATDANGGLSSTNTFTLTVKHVNQPPSFTTASNMLVVVEESPVVTNTGFIKGIWSGPTNGNQSGLTWNFAVSIVTTNATNAVFAIAPYIATNGTLYFQPQAHSYGTNLVTVVMTNSGGTTNGGINAFTNSFYIGVYQTNHAPVIAGAVNRTVMENGAAVSTTLNVWDYDLEVSNLVLSASSLATNLATVSVNTNVVILNNSNALFTVLYTPLANASGTVPIQIVATETNANGNNFSTTNNVTLTIIFITQPPSFTPASNLVVVAEESPVVTNTAFLTGLSAGPANEDGETWTITTSTATNNPILNAGFVVMPRIDTNGTLVFQPQPHSYGTNVVTVVMTDNAVSINGGAIAYTNTFSIGVKAISHAPFMVGVTDESVMESGAPAIATINVWDYDRPSSNLLTLAGTCLDNSSVTINILSNTLASASNVLFTVAFAATNTSGTAHIQLTATELGSGLNTTTNLTLNITPVNQPPSFLATNTLVLVPEESPQLTISNFLTAISPGPSDQSLETWTFTTVTDTNELATVDPNVLTTNAVFTVLPYVTADGSLILQPLAHSYGTNSVTVTMTTSGSTANGGINTYTTNFLIGIYQTNHAPNIAGDNDQVVAENGTVTTTINVWDYDLQSTNLTLTATSLSNLTTVSITATNIVTSSNTLFTVVYTPNLNTNGTDMIQLVATEGSLSTTNNPLVIITPANLPPVFTPITNLVLALEESPEVSITSFMTNISVGPNQSGETWTFTTTTDTSNPATNALFATTPSVGTNGTLIFQPLAHSYGTNAVTVTMTTSGSTANGGINTYTTNFLIGIIQTNHAPVIVATSQNMLENGGQVSTLVNVWDYDQASASLTLTATSPTNLVTVAVVFTNIWTGSNTYFQVTFTPTNNSTFGSADIALIATETTGLGTLSTTNNLAVNVAFVNQGPSFTLSTNFVTPTTNYFVPVLENTGAYITNNFATSLSVGPASQNGETWGFYALMATNDATNAVFLPPTVSTNGTLIVQSPVNSYGTNTVTLIMTNSGGTANGGINTYTNTFQIGIVQSDHAPVVVAPDQTVLENGAAISNTITVLDYDLDTNLTLTASSLSPALAAVSIVSTNFGTSTYNGITVSNATFQVIYTPAANIYGAFPIKLVATETDSSLSTTYFMTLNVTDVNQAPSCSLSSTNLVVLEESPAVTNAGFLAGISVGPAIQSGQTWTFTTTTVTNNATNAFFAVTPFVQTNGTLVFQPLAHSYGTNPVTVVMTTSGTTNNGGINTFTNTFVISVLETNHAPGITNATVLTVNESSAPVTSQISVWDYDSPSTNLLSLSFISLNSSQVTAQITGTSLVNATNVLYTVAFAGTNISGAFPIQLVATETNSGLATTNTLTLNVQYVNQPPTFNPTTNMLVVMEESPQVTLPAFFTGISVGPADQSSETWIMTTTTDTNHPSTNALFAVAPIVQNNGTLIFQPLPHSFGTNLVTVVMTTSGSTTNGGVNTCTNSFLLGIMATNHAPVIAGAVNQTVNENGAPVTALINVWDYDPHSTNLLDLTVSALNNSLATVSITGTNFSSATNVTYTVAFAGTNTSGQVPVQLVATEGSLATTNTLTLTIAYVNQPPSYSLNTNYISTNSLSTNILVQALEESLEVTNPGVVTAISVGPANQNGQTWSFATTTDTNQPGTNIFFEVIPVTNAMFAVMPWVDTNGTLYFQPTAHSYGTNSVTVVMTTSGSTANGGVNSFTNNFLIGIIQTNHAPVIASVPNQLTSENSSAITATVNVTDDYDQQSGNLVLTDICTNLAVVTIINTNVATSSNTVFTVLITPDADAFGTNTIQLIATQTPFGPGQTPLATTNTVTLGISFVNQPPSFSPSNNLVQVLEESPGVIMPGFLTNINVGATDQSGQTWSFTTTTDTRNPATNAGFAVMPFVQTNGTLLFQPQPHTYGTNLVTVVMTSSGPTSNGGVNTCTNSFLIGIIQTNHAPVFASGLSATTYENSGPITNIISVWDYDQQPANLSLATNTCLPALASVQIISTNVSGLVSNALFTVVITPSTNAFGTNTIQLVATEGTVGPGQVSLQTTNLLAVTITRANQPPSFTLSTNLVLALEESGVSTNLNVATNLSVGPVIQSGQTWSFTALTDTNEATNAFFAILPAVSTNGTLTFQPLAHSYGTNTVTLIMSNSGGTANGGVNACTNTFLIGIMQTNHAPGIVSATNVTVLENGTQTAVINVWDYDQTANLTLAVTSQNTNQAGASITDTNVVSASNVLYTVTFTPSNNVSGSVPFQLVATESGSSLSTTNTVTLSIAFVNQAPSFIQTNLVLALEESGLVSSTNLILSLSTGPTNQNWETWGFAAIAATGDATNALFAVPPTVSTNGTLTFQPLAHSYGTNTITLTMTNSGGTANGGINSYTANFLIGIIQTNHAPVIASSTNQTVLENSNLTATISVWDYDQTTNLTLAITSQNTNLVGISITGTNVASASNVLYTVTFSPSNNVSGSVPFQMVATETSSSLATTNTPTLNILFVNQAPSFALSTNNLTPTNILTVAENAGLTNISNFAIGMSVGPTNESGQTWSFTVYCPTNSATNASFATPPAISTNGTLAFKAANYSFGTNIATVVMTDSGGTANGGVNSYTNTFQLAVTQVQYPPAITGITNKTILENATTNVTLPFTLFDPLTTNFNVACVSSNSSLVTVSVSGVGTAQVLTFTPATNANGSSIITVTADDGSLTNSTNFILTVQWVNQAPSFSLKVTNVNVGAFNVAVAIPNAVTNILAGPTNQNTTGETVSFVVTNGNTGLFVYPPTVDASGTLTFTPGTQGGVVTVGVRAVNSGGTANGGVNTSPYQTFTITIPSNPFQPLAGVFAGLFYDTNNAGNASSGYFNLTLAADATFNGYVLCAGNSNLFAGRFNLTNNQATVTTANDTLSLSIDTSVNGTESITGTVTNTMAHWNVPLLSYLAGYSAADTTILAGDYNMSLPGFEDPIAGPAGDSVFNLAISTNGTVSLAGNMADSTPVSMTSQLSSGNLCPVYLPLYDNGAGGSVIGWLSFTGDLNNNVSTNSVLTWFDEANFSTLYTSGFTNQAEPLVLYYDNTLSGLLSFSSGTVILSGGNLTTAITNTVAISGNVIYVDPAATNGLSLYINPANGEILGSFLTPNDQTNYIDSVILQNSTNVVNGYFIGTSQGGSFTLFGN